MPFGGTDCALPVTYAMDKKIEVDVFIIYTDSETGSRGKTAHQALQGKIFHF